MNKYWAHFKTITKHKWIVMKLCFKCGLIKQGLLHDLSKYSPIEFKSSAKYFQGDKSPIEAEKIEKGYSLAWQHHKGHNPHHWEYWIDEVGTYKNIPVEIPFNYIAEMICDWVAAGIVYSESKCDFNKPYDEPLNYYNSHLNERIFHKESQNLIEKYLHIISLYGVNKFCEIMGKDLKSHYYN